MKDFSKAARVVEFAINRDVFRGKPHLAAQTMIDFTLKVESMDEKTATPKQGMDTMLEALQMVLMPDSYKRLRERMVDPTTGVANPEGLILERVTAALAQAGDNPVDPSVLWAALNAPVDPIRDATVDPDNPPIELDQLTDVVEWVMGEYGLRPTEPASDSSPGQPNPAYGTNSTVPTSGEVSISANSPSTGS